MRFGKTKGLRMMNLFLEGLFLQASLIFALGAQNIFVLESGLKRRFHLTVSFVCFFCDLLLIMIGVAGAATLFSAFPQIKILVGILGVVFLFHYGISKIFGNNQELVDNSESEEFNFKKSLKQTVILAVTFSILNPHAYLDAFILIGGFSSKYAQMNDRLTLGLGAACFSLIWFLVLSSASSYMKPFLSNPRRMRIVMSTAGLVLVMLSAKLSLDVYSWTIEDSSRVIAFTDVFNYKQPPARLFTSILF